MKTHWQKYLTEALGVFGLVFLAGGAVLSNAVTGGIGIIGIALASGLALAAMSFAAYHVSGAHLNPAVTIALFATSHVKTKDAVCYIGAQLTGSILAALGLKMIFSQVSPAFHLGGVAVGAGISPGLAVFIEAVMTFIFVYAYFAAGADKKETGRCAGLALGAIWTVSILIAWHLTGGALNPARSFGQTLVSNYWTAHYVYWIGPVIGALIAGFMYHFVYLKKND